MTVITVTVLLTVMVTVKALLLKIVLVTAVVLPNLISVVFAAVTIHVKKESPKVVLMISIPVVMVPASQITGNVMAGTIVQIQVMKPIVVLLKNVLMVNLHVMTVRAYLDHGNVMYTTVTVQDAKMKPIVVLHLVKIKDYGIVVMASVFQQVMFVMDQANFVTQDGVLTVPMAQMKA